MIDERPASDDAGTTTAAPIETPKAATITPAATATPVATQSVPAAPATVPPAATETPPAAPADDWRGKYVGKDKARLKTLERYTDEESYLTATFNLRKENEELRGKIKTAKPGADAKPEEIAAWRKASGIPEEPAAYVENLKIADGRIIGDNDKPTMLSFAEAMHKIDQPQAVVDSVASWYYEELERLTTEAIERDDSFLAESRIKLREDWSGDFDRNMSAIEDYLHAAPPEVREAILLGRTGDNRPIAKLGDKERIISGDPRVLRWLAQQAMDAGHAGGKPGFGAGYDGAMGGDSRIAEIESWMRGPDANQKYWKRPDVREEYRKLLEQRERMRARGHRAA